MDTFDLVLEGPVPPHSIRTVLPVAVQTAVVDMLLDGDGQANLLCDIPTIFGEVPAAFSDIYVISD